MSALRGRRVIITAGPTIEAIDPVRFLSNRSSGKQGYAIAAALAEQGADVTLVSGPTCLPCPTGVTRIEIESARDMLAAVEALLPAEVFVAVAAVADWRPETQSALKAEKSVTGASLALVENPDILRTIAQHQSSRPELVIGFAAETHDVLERARAKRLRKGCDWIIANDVSGDAMGGDQNAVTLIRSEGEMRWPRAGKQAVARKLVDEVARHLANV